MFDLANLDNILILSNRAPAAMERFNALGKAALAEGTISVENKKLISIAVALSNEHVDWRAIERASAACVRVGLPGEQE